MDRLLPYSRRSRSLDDIINQSSEYDNSRDSGNIPRVRKYSSEDTQLHMRRVMRCESSESAFSDDSCNVSEICSLLTDSQKARFESVEHDHTLQEPMERILREGFSSDLFDSIKTCDVLHWGLMNRKIKPNQFMEFYQYLMLRMTFLSNSLGINDYLRESITDIATSVQAVRVDDELYYSVILSDPDLSNKAWERNRFSSCKDDLKELVITWLSLIKSYGGSIYLEDGNLIVCSWENLLRHAASKNPHPQYNLTPMLTYGFGDWEKLKAFRYRNQHPVALWHPDIPESIIRPDGFKIGTLALLHDVYHIIRTNRVPYKDRMLMLDTDSICVAPALDWAESAARKERHPQDISLQKSHQQYFVEGFRQLCRDMTNGYASNYLSFTLKDEALLEKIFFELKKEGRPLIDQEQNSDASDTQGWVHSCPKLYNSQPERLFAVSVMIFRAIIASEESHVQFIERALGVSISKYPDTRKQMEKKEFSDRMNEDLSKKWLVDWWYRYCEDYPVD